MTIKEIKDKVAEYFSTRPEIKMGYIFGSRAKGEENKLSDIDIAVYLDEKIDEYKRFDIRLGLISEAGSLLKTDKIDLVILNDVDIFLAYQVVFFGKLIYCRNELNRIRYEAKTLSLYFDQQYYYDRHAKLTIERIAKEGIL